MRVYVYSNVNTLNSRQVGLNNAECKEELCTLSDIQTMKCTPVSRSHRVSSKHIAVLLRQ